MATKAPAKKAPARKTPAKKAKTPRVPDPINPWDQQLDETPPAYQAFIAYRDLGLARSQVKVAKQLGKSLALMARWSSRHQWAIRAAAWDRELDREFQLEQRQARRDAAKTNAKIAEAAMNRVARALATLSTSEMDAQAIARLMAEASKLQRLALGLSTENVEVSGPGGGPVETSDVSLLTDEERHARLLELRAEVDRRLGNGED